MKATITADLAKALGVYGQPTEDGEPGLQQVLLQAEPPSGTSANGFGALVVFPGRGEIAVEDGPEALIPAPGLLQVAGLTDKKHPAITATPGAAGEVRISGFSAKLKADSELLSRLPEKAEPFPDVGSVVGTFGRQDITWLHLRLARVKELCEMGKALGMDCVYLGQPVEPGADGLLPSAPGMQTSLSPLIFAYRHEGTKMAAEGFIMPASGVVPEIRRVGHFQDGEIAWRATKGKQAEMVTTMQAQADHDQATDALRRELEQARQEIERLKTQQPDELASILADSVRLYPSLLDLLQQAIVELEQEANSSGSSNAAGSK